MLKTFTYDEQEVQEAPHAKGVVFYKHKGDIFSLVATDSDGEIMAVCRYTKEDWLSITGQLLQRFAGPTCSERVS